MLNYLSLEEFIKTGEDVTKEFKPNFKNHRTDISKSMVAFANDLNWVGGGYVYLGVADDGTSRGISENYDEIQKVLADICRNQITPPLAPLIKKLPYQNKHIIEIKITRSINRPHRLNEICHVRIGSTTRRATREEEDLIKQCSIIPSFDNQPLAQATKDDILASV